MNYLVILALSSLGCWISLLVLEENINSYWFVFSLFFFSLLNALIIFRSLFNLLSVSPTRKLIKVGGFESRVGVYSGSNRRRFSGEGTPPLYRIERVQLMPNAIISSWF